MNLQAGFQSTMTDWLAQAAAYLPIFLTAMLIAAIGWLVARLLGGLARRLSARMGVDRLADRSGLSAVLSQAQITRPLSDLIALVVFWVVMLSALLISLDFAGLAVVGAPLQSLIAYLPNILAAMLVLIAGATLEQFLERVVRAAAAGAGIEFYAALGSAARVLVWVATVIIAVDQLGFDMLLFTTALVNGLTVIAAALALTFALGGRDVAGNVLAGYYARELYPLGSQVEIDGEVGTLEAIGSIKAEVRVDEGRVVLPNRDLIEKRVKVFQVREQGGQG